MLDYPGTRRGSRIFFITKIVWKNKKSINKKSVIDGPNGMFSFHHTIVQSFKSFLMNQVNP